MNILLISPSDPDDFSVGGSQRTHFLHRALSRWGTVHTVIPVMAASQECIDQTRRVARVCATRRWSFSWLMNHLLQRMAPLISYGPNVSPAHWNRWPDVKIDLVVCRYARWAVYCRAWQIAPLCLDVDDLPVESHRTLYGQQFASCLGKLFEKIILGLVSYWSRNIFKRSAGLWVANPRQVGLLANKNAGWLMNVPRSPAKEPAVTDAREEYILSVGYLGYSANYLGIDQFLDRVWPELNRRYPNLRFMIIGRDLPTPFKCKWQARPGVQLMGFVEDIEGLYGRSLFSVAPIYAGSGTCIKVLESMRLGRVCLASTFAARGLEEYQLEGRGLLLGATDEAMLEGAILLIESPADRMRMELCAVELMKKNFAYDQFCGQVDRVIHLAITRTASA